MTKRILFSLLILLTVSNLTAQRPSGAGPGDRPNFDPSQGGVVAGHVIDANSQQSIEYANIAIYSKENDKLITGGISDTEGRIMVNGLKAGEYYAIIKFIGYESFRKDDIVISDEKPFSRLGQITLNPEAHNLNEVEVLADKQQVEFKIDKKVVNASQFLTAQGGTAVDILQNTPSVSVDIEGNVSMRGSSNFMVLINGKPTPFEASDALEQVPASSIENIEIITNPSAKYDPDGAAGIINIITKKEAEKGWNGILNANVNTLGSYSGDFLFNFNKDKINWYIGANRRDHKREAEYTNGSGTINPATNDTIHIQQEGERMMNFVSNSAKTGIAFDINDKNSLALKLEGGNRGRKSENELSNYEWATGETKTSTVSSSNSKDKGYFGSVTLEQSSQFGNNKEHKLESSLFYQKHISNDESYAEKSLIDSTSILKQNTWEEGNTNELRFKTDYTKPWAHGKIEAGYQLRLDDQWSNYDASFDTLTTPIDFYSENNFFRMINSAYGTFSGEFSQFGYQVGLRAEHTLRKLENIEGENISNINRWDFFPTIHLSYNISQAQSVMASYTRRIDRPRNHTIDPYVKWQDPNNVMQGNPDLLPQYVNSIEASYQLRFGEMNFLSAEIFHRNVKDKMERIRSKYEDGILMTKHENVGQDFSTGVELMVNYNFFNWWTSNISGSLYHYSMDIDEEFASSVRATSSTNWRARWSNTFKPMETLRIQLDLMYNSPTVTATGTRSAMSMSSLAVKKSFFKRKLDVGVSVSDIFNTAKMESESYGDTFYSYNKFDMKSPTFQFSISYLFNNYKQNRQRGNSGGMENVDMEF